MEEQQKWFIPHEISEVDALLAIAEIEKYIVEHPDEVDDYWLVDFDEKDMFAKSFPKKEVDKAAAESNISVFQVMMDLMRLQNGVTPPSTDND